MNARSNSAGGFTLVETLIAVALAAILITVAIPSFREVTMNNRILTDTHALTASFFVARSEAIKRGAPVSICASNTGTGCTTDTP